MTEHEYGQANEATKRKKVLTRKTWLAVVVGVLLIAVVAADFYAIHYLRAKIIRTNSWAGIAAMLAKGQEQKRLFQAIGISEVTLWIWSRTAWAACGLLGLAGLWAAIRRRFGWRMLWAGAIATILASILTVAGRWTLTKYAHFDSLNFQIYALVFLAHSLPGWLIVGAGLIRRSRLRREPERVAPPAESPLDAANGSAEPRKQGGQESSGQAG